MAISMEIDDQDRKTNIIGMREKFEIRMKGKE